MTDKQNKLIPKLRFPEFKNDGEWESYAIEDLFEVRNGYTPSKSNPEFWEGGKIPWFRMEDIRQNGHILSDSIQHITPQAVKGTGLFPAYSIIVATTATIGEHALLIADSLANQRFTFLTKRKSLDDKLDMMFFHQYMFIVDEWCKRNTNFGGLLSVNMSAFKKLRVPVPSIQEQKRIADFLTSLDILLAGTKAKLEQLIDHKKGLMQKLFPAPGETTPEYRFADCNNGSEWPVKRLGELFCRIVEKNTENNQNVLTISAQFGLVSQSDYFHKSVSSNDITNYILIQRGDFAYNKSRSQGYPYGTVKSLQLYEKGVVSPLYLCFRPRNVKTNTLFYGYYFESESFNLELGRVAQEGARNHGLLNISPSDFFDSICVAIPQPKEQERIAQSLFSIDSLILSYSNRLFQIERYKNGLLQQLFPSFE